MQDMTDATGRQAAADLVTHFLRDPSRYPACSNLGFTHKTMVDYLPLLKYVVLIMTAHVRLF